MSYSLKSVKDNLITKGGYNITPNNNQLKDLKDLIDNMNSIRNGVPPQSGLGDYSGTKCNGHISGFNHNGKVSLGDIGATLPNIKQELCASVIDKTCGCNNRTSCSCNSVLPGCKCNTRTGSCSCNSNTPICQCNTRTGSCDCNNYTSVCTCNNRTSPSCDCQNRSGCDHHVTGYVNEGIVDGCGTRGRCSCNSLLQFPAWINPIPSCSCNPRENCGFYCTCYQLESTPCVCDSRTPPVCDCNNRTSSCGTVSPPDKQCETRTGSCGTVSPPDTVCSARAGGCGTVLAICQCDGRCACNAERRFG